MTNQFKNTESLFLRDTKPSPPHSRFDLVKIIRVIGIILLILFLLSGVRIIQPGEVGVLLRLGRLPDGPSAVNKPGLMISFPYPIDEVIRVPVMQNREMVIDAFWHSEDVCQTATTFHPFEQGYCITGDYNVVLPKIAVKYNIADPVAWVLSNKDPDRLLLDAVAAELVHVIGEMRVDDLLTERKAELVFNVKSRAQARLDSINAGSTILSIEITELIPPRSILPDFQDVQNAYIGKETAIRNAEAYKAQQIPAARAEANRIINAAETYSVGTLATANGEANSFLEILEEYRLNPDVVKQRLLLEYLTLAYIQVGNRYVVPGDPVSGRLLIPPS